MINQELYLEGDLNQMAIQAAALSGIDITLRSNGVYRIIASEDVEKALIYIWLNSIEGWWHYKELYMMNTICTSEEFLAKLQLSIKKER